MRTAHAKVNVSHRILFSRHSIGWYLVDGRTQGGRLDTGLECSAYLEPADFRKLSTSRLTVESSALEGRNSNREMMRVEEFFVVKCMVTLTVLTQVT